MSDKVADPPHTHRNLTVDTAGPTNLAQLKKDLAHLNQKIAEGDRLNSINKEPLPNLGVSPTNRSLKRAGTGNLNNKTKDNKIIFNNYGSPTSMNSSDLSYKILNEILNSQSKDRTMLMQKVYHKASESKKSLIPISGQSTDGVEGAKPGIEDSEQIKSLQQAIEQTTAIIATKSEELEAKKQKLESLTTASKTDEDKLKGEYMQAKQKYDEFMTKKALFKSKMEIDEKKERLKFLRTEIEGYKAELIKVEEAIKKRREEISHKEKAIKDEYDSQLKQFEDALNTIQEQKIGIHQKLNEAILMHSQALEQKAMLKEDLNGKLIQRAELVGHREELDEVYQKLRRNHKLEIEFYYEENRLNDSLKKISESIKICEDKKKGIMAQLEIKSGPIKELQEKLQFIQRSYQTLVSERSKKVTADEAEIERLESLISSKAQAYGIPELDDLFTELCNSHGRYVEKEILSRQLRLIDEEEKNITNKFEQKEYNLLEAIGILKEKQGESPEIDEEIVKLTIELEQLKIRYELRKEAIFKWKDEVTQVLNENKNADGYEEIDTQDKFIAKIKEKMAEKNIPTDQQEEYENIIQEYLKKVELHEIYLNLKQHEENKLQEESKLIEDKIEQISQEKVPIEEELSILENELSEMVSKKATIEQELKEKSDAIQKHLTVEAEEAFTAYIQQNAATFEQIQKEYGSQAVEEVKQEHYKEFINLTKDSQTKRMQKYFRIKKEIKHLEIVIADNIKAVDESILPSLKKNAASIANTKALVAALKKQQLTLLETEDEVAGQMDGIIQTKEAKLKATEERFTKSQTIQQLTEARAFLKKKKDQIEKEMTFIENKLIECDQIISYNNVEEKKLAKDVQTLLEQLRQHQENKQVTEKAREEVVELEREVRRLNKQLEEYEMQKLMLEQKYVEQNYLNDEYNPQSLILNDKSCASQESFDDELDKLNSGEKENVVEKYKIGLSENKSPSGKPREISPIKQDINSPEQHLRRKKVFAEVNQNSSKANENAIVSPRDRERGVDSSGKTARTRPKENGSYLKQHQMKLNNSKTESNAKTERREGRHPISNGLQITSDSDQKAKYHVDRPNKFEEINLMSTIPRALSNDSQFLKKTLSPDSRNLDLSSPKNITLNLRNLALELRDNNTPNGASSLENTRTIKSIYSRVYQNGVASSQVASANTSQLNYQDMKTSYKGNRTQSQETSIIADEITPQKVDFKSKTAPLKDLLARDFGLEKTQSEEKLMRNNPITPETMANRILELNSSNKRSKSAEQHGGNRKKQLTEIQERVQTQPDTREINSAEKKLVQESLTFSKTMPKDAPLSSRNHIYKFRIDNCTSQDIAFFEWIRPMLEGRHLYKKFSSYQSLKRAAFDPLAADINPPDSCGFGLRLIRLATDLDKLEVKHSVKHTVEGTIALSSIIRPVIPQLTLDILKVQKRTFDMNNPFSTQHKSTDNISTKALLLQRGPNISQNFEKYLACSHYPFSLLLEKGGRIDFIAPNYTVFKEWINGVNALLKYKKYLDKMKHRIETYCI